MQARGGARGGSVPAQAIRLRLGTVFGSAMAWPNHFFWIAAMLPSSSIFISAALIASVSDLSSSRPTQEK